MSISFSSGKYEYFSIDLPFLTLRERIDPCYLAKYYAVDLLSEDEVKEVKTII